jgi:hypothetical protein
LPLATTSIDPNTRPILGGFWTRLPAEFALPILDYGERRRRRRAGRGYGEPLAIGRDIELKVASWHIGTCREWGKESRTPKFDGL